MSSNTPQPTALPSVPTTESTNPVNPATSTDPPPDADAGSDHDAGVIEVEQDLGDLGGDADDGDDSNPHKFIEKSLKFQDMLMTKKHAEERVEFFEEFRKSMPSGKDPHKKIELYKARVIKVDERITKFRQSYAKKRVDSKKSRADRITVSKAEKEHEKCLGKDFKSAISKVQRKASIIATKAAAEAVRALGEAAKEEDVKKARGEAFSKAMQAAMLEAMKDSMFTGIEEVAVAM